MQLVGRFRAMPKMVSFGRRAQHHAWINRETLSEKQQWPVMQNKRYIVRDGKPLLLPSSPLGLITKKLFLPNPSFKSSWSHSFGSGRNLSCLKMKDFDFDCTHEVCSSNSARSDLQFGVIVSAQEQGERKFLKEPVVFFLLKSYSEGSISPKQILFKEEDHTR